MKKSMGGKTVKEWTPAMNNDWRDSEYAKKARSGEMKNPFSYHQPGVGEYEYNRAAGQINDDLFDVRRGMNQDFAKRAQRNRELSQGPTPQADAGMDVMNSLPTAQQIEILDQFRNRRRSRQDTRSTQPIFNPYSA
jgi:hypothetical protein